MSSVCSLSVFFTSAQTSGERRLSSGLQMASLLLPSSKNRQIEHTYVWRASRSLIGTRACSFRLLPSPYRSSVLRSAPHRLVSESSHHRPHSHPGRLIWGEEEEAGPPPFFLLRIHSLLSSRYPPPLHLALHKDIGYDKTKSARKA